MSCLERFYFLMHALPLSFFPSFRFFQQSFLSQSLSFFFKWLITAYQFYSLKLFLSCKKLPLNLFISFALSLALFYISALNLNCFLVQYTTCFLFLQLKKLILLPSPFFPILYTMFFVYPQKSPFPLKCVHALSLSLLV